MIVVLGDIAVDIVSYLHAPLARGSDAGADIRVMPGGSGANVAAWLARLGQPVTFLGRVGDDLFGRWLTDDLRREGVTPGLTIDDRRPTGVIQVLVEPGGERTMVPDRGANSRRPAEEIPEDLVAGASLLHVVGYVLIDEESRPGALRAMQLARSHGVPVSLDPSSHAPLSALGARGFWEQVGQVDVLFPNLPEAQMLTGTDDPESAAAALLEHARLAVIKLGADGCLAAQGAARWRVPAPQVPVANTTGAGDAFAAGFLAAWLPAQDVEAACRNGVHLGSHCAGLPTTR